MNVRVGCANDRAYWPTWDSDKVISRLYGAVEGYDPSCYRRFWLVLDPMLQVLRMEPLEHTEAVMAFVAALLEAGIHGGPDRRTPVLVVPLVFEPDFCRHLIGLYQGHGSE